MQRKLKCILLIDDDRATNFLNEFVIKKADCTEHIQVAGGGGQALEFLKSGVAGNSPRPDLILLDINMPLMNGWQFLEEFRKLEMVKKDEIVIVMLTTSINPEDQAVSETIVEVAGFRHKPLTRVIIDELLQAYFPDSL